MLSVVRGNVDTRQNPLAAPRTMKRWLPTVPAWDKLVRAVPVPDGALFSATRVGPRSNGGFWQSSQRIVAGSWRYLAVGPLRSSVG